MIGPVMDEVRITRPRPDAMSASRQYGFRAGFGFFPEIAKYLKLLGVSYEFRVASAHKTPEKVIEIIKESENEKIVYVTVAGRSNALSAFIDGNTSKPVIACPPYSEKFGGQTLSPR